MKVHNTDVNLIVFFSFAPIDSRSNAVRLSVADAAALAAQVQSGDGENAGPHGVLPPIGYVKSFC